jgi:hypothetical protein
MKSPLLEAGLCLAIGLSCLATAHAQSTPSAAPTPAQPAAAPKPAEDASDSAEAPKALLTLPMPGSAAPAPNGNGNGNGIADAADATPDVDFSDSLPGDPWGDPKTASIITLRLLMQTRYTSTFGAESQSSRASYVEREELLAENNDGWGIERLMLRLSSDPVKYIGFKAVLDFSELISGDPEDVVKQGYTTISPIPGRLELALGLFKLPFSIFELDPTARFEFAEFGPTNQLLGDLGFGGRDLGFQILGAPLRKAKRLRVSAGMFRGHSHDEHDSPLGTVAGRIEYKPLKSLRLGLDAVYQPFSVTYNRPFETSDKEVLPNPPDPMYPAARHWGKGGAYGFDARFKKKGFMARGEFVYGDRVDVDRRYDARRFWSAWGIFAYSFEVHEDVKLLPALRLEWLDSDATHGPGAFVTASASFTCIAWTRVRFLIDGTYTHVEDNTPVLAQPKPLQADPYMALSNTRLTVQLQVEL